MVLFSFFPLRILLLCAFRFFLNFLKTMCLKFAARSPHILKAVRAKSIFFFFSVFVPVYFAFIFLKEKKIKNMCQ